MPLANPSTIFGFHHATIFDRETKELTPIIVTQAYTPSLSEETIDLNGGASPYPWDSAGGTADSTIGFTVSQFDLNILRYLGGDVSSAYTENASGEAAGFASALINEIGTSVFSATTGIATVSVKSGGNPKFGNYLVKAVTSTTVDVYLDCLLDGVPMINNSMKITSSPLTITSGGSVEIPGVDLELDGGSGTIGLTTGDIASFNARPQNDYNYEYRLGDASKPEFGLRIYTERLGTNKYRAWDFPRVKANGINPSGAAKEWSQIEAECKMLYDNEKGYAGRLIVVNR